jgi:hypothetical protein
MAKLAKEFHFAISDWQRKIAVLASKFQNIGEIGEKNSFCHRRQSRRGVLSLRAADTYSPLEQDFLCFSALRFCFC